MPETRTTSSTGGEKGVKLARFDLIPAGPLRELAEHYGRGARKYADNQWRQGYEWSKSIGALGRHFNAFMAGFDYDVCSNDPEGCSFVDAAGEPYEPVEPDTCFNHTGSHHMAAVAWHAFLLLEFKDTHPAHDDRYKEPLGFEIPVDWAPLSDRYKAWYEAGRRVFAVSQDGDAYEPADVDLEPNDFIQKLYNPDDGLDSVGGDL